MGSSEAKEIEPTVEEVVAKELSINLPQYLCALQVAKNNFIVFCQDTWLYQRKTTLNSLKEMESNLEKQKVHHELQSIVLKRGEMFIKWAGFFGYLILFSYLFLPDKIILYCGLVVTLAADYAMYKLGVGKDDCKVKAQLKTCMPILESDRKQTEKARQLWGEVESSFLDLQQELDYFIQRIQYRKIDVDAMKTQEIVRFLNQTRDVKTDDKVQMQDFLKSYLELIYKVDVANEIFMFSKEEDHSSAGCSKPNYERTSRAVGNQISVIMNDLDTYFEKLDVEDIMKEAWEIAASDTAKAMQKLSDIQLNIENGNRLVQQMTNTAPMKKNAKKLSLLRNRTVW